MDTKAWKTEDKDWMKDRRSEWKCIKKSLDKLTGVRSKDIKFIKTFYMSGQVDIDEMIKNYGRKVVDPERLLYPMEAPILLECWLTADQSNENWDVIKTKYGERKLYHSRRRFLELLNYYPEAGSFFSGLEERLYRFLCPTRCRPEDYPEKNEIQYQEQCRRVWAQITRNVDEFMQAKHPNPHNFVRYRLHEWKDAIVPTWILRGDSILEYVAGTVRVACTIIKTPDYHDPLAIEAAREIIKLLDDPALPEPLQAMMIDMKAE